MIRTTGFTICIATILFVGSGPAWSQSQQAESAEVKAEALEQSSSSEGDQTRPSPSGIITKPEAQAVDPAGEMPLDDALTCLARTIYWEARGEETAGIEAIAHVVMNRLGHEGFPGTICEVVRQGSEQGACQFSAKIQSRTSLTTPLPFRQFLWRWIPVSRSGSAAGISCRVRGRAGSRGRLR